MVLGWWGFPQWSSLSSFSWRNRGIHAEKALLQTTSSNGQEIYGSISSYLSIKSNRIESSFSIPSDLVDPIGHLVRRLKISCSVHFSMMERGAFLGLSSALGAKVPAPQNASKKWGGEIQHSTGFVQHFCYTTQNMPEGSWGKVMMMMMMMMMMISIYLSIYLSTNLWERHDTHGFQMIPRYKSALETELHSPGLASILQVDEVNVQRPATKQNRKGTYVRVLNPKTKRTTRSVLYKMIYKW